MLFEDVGGSLGNMFLFCTKWVSVYTHCVTPSRGIYTELRHLIFGGFMVMSFT